MSDLATDCDRCGGGIPIMHACFVVPTGRTWDGDDPDKGKAVVRILCVDCYYAERPDVDPDTLETRTAIIVPDPSLDI